MLRFFAEFILVQSVNTLVPNAANVCTDIDQNRRASITDQLVAYCYDKNGGTGPSVCAICNDPRIARGDFLLICSAHRLHGEKSPSSSTPCTSRAFTHFRLSSHEGTL